jgi:hypothetical protein
MKMSPCRLKPENDSASPYRAMPDRPVFALVSFAAARQSSLYRAFIFVKTTPQHVAAPSPPVNHRIPIARNRFENIRKILAV